MRTAFYIAWLLIAAAFAATSPSAKASSPNAPQQPQKAPWYSHKKAENFHELRHLILDLIGRAESRVILVTDFLTDGEISSALYLAKYRKIQTVVIVNQAHINRYLSRVNYLRAQSIPVFVRSAGSQFQEPSLLLVDRYLFRISRDLDVLKPDQGGEIRLAKPKLIADFEKEIIEIIQGRRQAVAEPLPLVGRPGSQPVARQNVPRHYQGEVDGSYNYDRSGGNRGSAPQGIPTQLPRSTIYQQRQEVEKLSNESKEEEQVLKERSNSAIEQTPEAWQGESEVSSGFERQLDLDRRREDKGSQSEEWFHVE